MNAAGRSRGCSSAARCWRSSSTLLIIVGGLAAFLGVEVRELPTVEQPVLSVSTSFPGAAAETVDREITATVEGAVASRAGRDALFRRAHPTARAA